MTGLGRQSPPWAVRARTSAPKNRVAVIAVPTKVAHADPTIPNRSTNTGIRIAPGTNPDNVKIRGSLVFWMPRSHPFPAMSMSTNGIAKLVTRNHWVASCATVGSCDNHRANCGAPTHMMRVRTAPTTTAIHVACTPSLIAPRVSPAPYWCEDRMVVP